jgi:hypothetical protein
LVGIITERDIIRMVDQLGGEKLAIGGEEEVRLNLIDQYSMFGRFVDNWLQRYHPKVMGEKESHSLLLQLQLNNEASPRNWNTYQIRDVRRYIMLIVY